jgi:hypothetical protein
VKGKMKCERVHERAYLEDWGTRERTYWLDEIDPSDLANRCYRVAKVKGQYPTIP